MVRQAAKSQADARPRRILALLHPTRRKAVILVALGVVWTLGSSLAAVSRTGRLVSSAGSPTSGDPSLYQARRTRLAMTVSTRGDLESSKSRDVVNEVEGQSTIIFLKPEGSLARKGELVCELDSSSLRESLTNQDIAIQKAEAELKTATETREVAEMAINEYLGGTYPQQLQDAEFALKLANLNLAEAVSRFEWSGRMVEKGFLPRSQHLADRDLWKNCEIALQTAKTKIRVLSSFTRQKTLTELRAGVEAARSDELAKKAALALTQSQQAKLRAQVAKCKMFAPADGLITYVNSDRMRPGGNQPLIEEGATVRERQAIIRLPDVSQMRVLARVDESEIKGVVPGNPVRVRVDAFPGQTLEGAVGFVQPIAAASMPFQTESRLYTVLIPIARAPAGLRPGMTAQVDILVKQRENVLAVPLESVLQFQGKSHVFVASRQGFHRREVRLGASGDKLVEIASGLGEGEDVSLDPRSLMSEAEKREAFAAGPFTSQEDKWE